jgi:hypothetical protein
MYSIGSHCWLRTVFKAAIVALVLFTAQAALGRSHTESAYGFFKGMTLKQARAAAPIKAIGTSASIFATSKPPRPAAPFTYYTLVVSPIAGVCAITAMTDPEAEETKSFERKVTSLLARLTRIHGPPADAGDSTDRLEWQDPLGPGTEIALAIARSDDGVSQVTLTYAFSNRRECQAAFRVGL